MEVRIKWEEVPVLLENCEDKVNDCTLVWEGVNKTSYFNDWKVKLFRETTAAREHCKRFHIDNLFDLALTENLVGLEEIERV